MPPDRPPLPASVLAALGLVSGCVGSTCLKYTTDTGTAGPCLMVVPYTHSAVPCLEFTYEHTGYVGPCLDVPPVHTGPAHTGYAHTGPCLYFYPESGGSGGHSGAAAAVAPPTPSTPVFERLSAEGVLPPDVIERLGRRGR